MSRKDIRRRIERVEKDSGGRLPSLIVQEEFIATSGACVAGSLVFTDGTPGRELTRGEVALANQRRQREVDEEDGRP